MARGRKAAANKKAAAVRAKVTTKETLKAVEAVETVETAAEVKEEKVVDTKVEKSAEPVKAVEAATTEKVENAEEAAKAEAPVDAVKKAPAKKAAIKEEFFLQFGGNEVSQADVIKKVKENWTKVQKKKIKDIKTISVYLQPENGCAYYVINGEGAEDYKVEL